MPIIKYSTICLCFDEENDILCDCCGYDRYINLETLLFIKSKIDNSIEFAKNNDVVLLNKEFLDIQPK